MTRCSQLPEVTSHPSLPPSEEFALELESFFLELLGFLAGFVRRRRRRFVRVDGGHESERSSLPVRESQIMTVRSLAVQKVDDLTLYSPAAIGCVPLSSSAGSLGPSKHMSRRDAV